MNQQQQDILKCLQMEDMTTGAIAQILGMNTEQTRYHLYNLEREGAVKRAKHTILGNNKHAKPQVVWQVGQTTIIRKPLERTPEEQIQRLAPKDHCPPEKVAPQPTITSLIEQAINLMEQAANLATEKDRQNADVAAGLALISDALKRK